MAVSRRQVVLAAFAWFALFGVAASASAQGPDMTNVIAGTNSNQQGWFATVTYSWYTAYTDRTVNYVLFPVLGNGNYGPGINGQMKPVGAGSGSATVSYGPLPAGTYQAFIALIDSEGNVTSHAEQEFVVN
jgi:hypothetical protein